MFINFSKDEYQYLTNADYIDKKFLDILFKFNKLDGAIIVELQDEFVSHLREQLEDRLQVAGFDSNYELTKEGFIIEHLIDKLFIG